MTRKVLYFTMTFSIFFGLQVFAQSIDEIINKNIEARGGYQKLKAVGTMKITGKTFVQSMEIPFTVQSKRPNFTRMESKIQDQTMVQAYDGETAWAIMPFLGITEPEKLPAEQAKSVIEQADFDGHLVDYRIKGHKAELMGKEDVEGTEAFKLKITLKNGDIRYVFIDTKSFLELKWIAKIQRQGNEIESEAFFSNFKDVNGLMMAFSVENRVSENIVSKVVIEKVELNVRIDNSIFKMSVKNKDTETPKK